MATVGISISREPERQTRTSVIVSRHDTSLARVSCGWEAVSQAPYAGLPRLPARRLLFQNTGCANRIFSVQRPFLLSESMPRTTWVQGFSHAATKIKVDAEHPARIPAPLSSCCCNIGEMARKVSVKCAIAGCHYQRKMTLVEREELRRVGRENNATAGVVCPAHVRAAFNFEFDDIDIDVPLEELLVESSKETPRWRVMLTPLPGAAGEPDSESMPGRGDRVI